MSAKPKATEPAEKRKHGDEWLNQISGQIYRWDAIAEHWVPTGKYPYGSDPMGLING